ncbi:cohesin subunit SA-2 isoform X1 [Gadus morhua]|uniref:cohesin subunit SA-2 isoform X1 n=4 Tax=Gadus morhua TaxID=8049 RepID=UPI0011B79C1B|nr:cohesin subunit SA-2-like isoform X1 [Gadus morhua]
MIPDPSTPTSRPLKHNENYAIHSAGAVSHSGDESGNENRRKSARGKKRPRMCSENTTQARGKASPGSPGRAGGGGGRRGRVQAVSLFEVVTMGRDAMQTVIGDWIETYAMDRDSALLDLISFFIQCSGCKGVVTAEMCQSNRVQDRGDILSKMVEKVDEESGLQYKKFMAFPWILTVTWPMDMDCAEYPLIQSGPYGRWFHSEFGDFVSVLVSQCQHCVVFDGYLMNALVSLLTELSDSCVRAFRHTCTLAAVKILSALVAVALSLSTVMENSQKLHGVERRKTSGRQGSPRLDRMKKKIAELQEKRLEIESIMDTIFKGVFLKRYRDVLPEIRSMCTEELCLWMKLYSTAFLTDSYLKYIGWMMHDKIPEVRLKCVLGLQGLYGDPLLLTKLDLFTSRFKDRLISMTLDRDNEVALQAMKLLILISKSCEEVLEEGDYQQLYRFVFSSQRPLAALAGELLYSRLLNAPAPGSEGQEGAGEGEARGQDVHTERTLVRLRALLTFYMQSELHKHVVYLVDGLWDCAGDLLKDWPTLTHILLQEAPPQCTGLTEAEQAVVVEVLVASVRQAAEGPSLVGRSGGKKVSNAKERKTQSDDCAKLTQQFLSALPKLLSKFAGRWDAIASLMKIPQFFVPECLTAENTQAASEELIREMGAVVDHPSGPPAVLEAVSRAYLRLCGGDTAWHPAARPARDALVQRWKDRLISQLGVGLKEDTFCADIDQTGEMLSTLRKLRAFYNCHDLSQWDLFELLSPLLSVGCLQGGVPSEVILEVLQCLFNAVLWNLHTSGRTLSSRDKAVAQRQQLSAFCETSYRCLSHADAAVKEQAFLGVCDVLAAHSYQLNVWEPASCGPLLYTPGPRLQRALQAFLLEQVLVGPDSDAHSRVCLASEGERQEDHQKRRTLLAAYCKLLVHGVLEMSNASVVFTHYTKYYNDFGDIIKETLYRTRQTDKIGSARTLLLCLQELYVRLKQEQRCGGGGPPGVQTFTSIKELARRFALTFGDPAKFRESVTMIHRSGIEFVFSGFVQAPDAACPPYLTYLTILSEFSSKLLKPDKKTLFCFLQRQTADHVVHSREDCWQPLVYYRASLLATAAAGGEGEDVASYVSCDRRPHPPSRSPNVNKQQGQVSPVDSRSNRASVSSSLPEDRSEAGPSPVAMETRTAATVMEELHHVMGKETGDELVEVDL